MQELLPQGLRIQENKKFLNFWKIVQEEASKHDSVFFLDSGEGNEIETAEINDEGKVELSNIAKDISNKVIYIYDNLVTAINEQRCENLKLQLEISNITKEKNNLRHEVELLTEAVRKLEVSLGVDQSPAYERMLEFSSK